MAKAYNGVFGAGTFKKDPNSLVNTEKVDLTATPVIEAKATVSEVFTKYHKLSPAERLIFMDEVSSSYDKELEIKDKKN